MSLRFSKALKAASLNRRQAADDSENSCQACPHRAAGRLQKQLEELQDYTDLVNGRLREICAVDSRNNPVLGQDSWDGPQTEVERAQHLVSHNNGLDATFRERIAHAFHVIILLLNPVLRSIAFRILSQNLMISIFSPNDEMDSFQNCWNWQRKTWKILLVFLLYHSV